MATVDIADAARLSCTGHIGGCGGALRGCRNQARGLLSIDAARLETQAIDAYNDAHHYRAENPFTHLHEDEAPVETDKLKSFH